MPTRCTFGISDSYPSSGCPGPHVDWPGALYYVIVLQSFCYVDAIIIQISDQANYRARRWQAATQSSSNAAPQARRPLEDAAASAGWHVLRAWFW